jgi:hypothetical protein
VAGCRFEHENDRAGVAAHYDPVECDTTAESDARVAARQSAVAAMIAAAKGFAFMVRAPSVALDCAWVGKSVKQAKAVAGSGGISH